MCVKCYVVYTLKYEILQSTWKKQNKSVLSYMGKTKKHRMFLVSFFMWFETFQILMCELQIIWRAVLRLCSLHNKNPLKYIWLFMTLFYTKCALCLLMISNWFFMHRQARMKALQATFPDVQEDEEFKIGKRFNFPKPISEPPSPTSTRGMLYIH